MPTAFESADLSGMAVEQGLKCASVMADFLLKPQSFILKNSIEQASIKSVRVHDARLTLALQQQSFVVIFPVF